MIGSFSQIPCTTFSGGEPVALVGLVITVGLVALFHREEFAGSSPMTAAKVNIHVGRVLVARALVAILWGTTSSQGRHHRGLLLLTRRAKSEWVYAKIDWGSSPRARGTRQNGVVRNTLIPAL